MTVQFTITIVGSGEDVDDCWNDAVVSLSIDPGSTPEEEYEIMEDDEEEDEEENEDEF